MIPLLINESTHRMPKSYLIKWVALLTKTLGREIVNPKTAEKLKKEIVLVFVDATVQKKINSEFRGKRYATDVLSFVSEDPQNSMGELVLCPEVIRIQAKEHGLSFREELAYMVLHGILHLLGYDHETGARQAKIMFEIQDRVFEKTAVRRLNL